MITITIIKHELGNHPRVFENIEVETLPVVDDIIVASDGERTVTIAYGGALYKGYRLFETLPNPWPIP